MLLVEFEKARTLASSATSVKPKLKITVLVYNIDS